MRITDLKPGKTANKIHVYLDGEYALTVTERMLSEYSLKTGMELDGAFTDRLRGEYQCARAKDRALRVLSIRDHSRHELRQKLLRDFSEEAADFAVEEMEAFGYLNDRRFAASYAGLLQKNKKMALPGIERELERKGIDGDVIREVLSEFEEEPRLQIAEIVRKKYKNAPEDEKEKRRAVNTLVRLGYGYSDIFDVLDDMKNGFDGED